MLHAAMLVMMFALGADPPAGERIDLGEARLFVPAGYRPEGGAVNLVIHLHGADAIVERALVEAGWPAALIVFNRSGLSSVYAKPFADRALFDRLLARACEEVGKVRSPGSTPKVGRVVVSSFSAGFGGVRAILNDPAHFDRVDALVLADSLYCGYAEPAAERRVDPALMAGFRRFAREAAAGRRAMLVSHSAQVPEGYASTTETADDLVREVGGTATPDRRDRGDGWVETRRFTRGGFLVIGFAGEGAEDHLRHLRRIAELWKLLPNPFPAPGH
jgi:hypothetical protein